MRVSSRSPRAWPSVSLIDLEAVDVHEQDGDACPLLAGQPGEGMLGAIVEQAPVGEAGERVVERPMAELLVEPPVLDRHGRLERQRPGEGEPAHVDRVGLGARQLGDPDRALLGGEGQEQHGRSTEGPEAVTFERVRPLVGHVDHDRRLIAGNAREHGPRRDRLGSRLQRTLGGMRSERGKPLGIGRERVDDAVVEPGRLGEVPRDKPAEHPGVGRLGEVG